eukprot:8756752-Karenia_brevis.AAC.1
MKNDVGAVKAQVHDVNTSVNVMKTQQQDGFNKLASLIQNMQNNNNGGNIRRNVRADHMGPLPAGNDDNGPFGDVDVGKDFTALGLDGEGRPRDVPAAPAMVDDPAYLISKSQHDQFLTTVGLNPETPTVRCSFIDD